MSAEESLELYRRQAREAARDLGYKASILAAIKTAKSEAEILRLMRKGRESL